MTVCIVCCSFRLDPPPTCTSGHPPPPPPPPPGPSLFCASSPCLHQAYISCVILSQLLSDMTYRTTSFAEPCPMLFACAFAGSFDPNHMVLTYHYLLDMETCLTETCPYKAPPGAETRNLPAQITADWAPAVLQRIGLLLLTHTAMSLLFSEPWHHDFVFATGTTCYQLLLSFRTCQSCNIVMRMQLLGLTQLLQRLAKPGISDGECWNKDTAITWLCSTLWLQLPFDMHARLSVAHR